jgi:hypothetical protein
MVLELMQQSKLHKNLSYTFHNTNEEALLGVPFFMLGFAQGCDVSAGTIGTGAALGDFNGYQLTFMAEEELPPLFIAATNELLLMTKRIQRWQ